MHIPVGSITHAHARALLKSVMRFIVPRRVREPSRRARAQHERTIPARPALLARALEGLLGLPSFSRRMVGRERCGIIIKKVFREFRLNTSAVGVAVATPSQTVAIPGTQRVFRAGAHRHDGHRMAAVAMQARTAIQVRRGKQLEIRREAGAFAFFFLA